MTMITDMIKRLNSMATSTGDIGEVNRLTSAISQPEKIGDCQRQ